ncbi:MAG: restriction endonuclease subunit S [Akkermansia sp.]|nr:restriction endonuclease subunit S [Akkermansia sp.]
MARQMKDSGVEWIGEIPETWEVINPKALFRLRKEKAALGQRQLTSSQQYGIVYQDEYMKLTGAKVVTVEKDFEILKQVESGDFVISMRSFQGGIEYSPYSGSISSAYVMLIPNKNCVYSPFYKWLLKSSEYIRALQSTSNMVRDGQAMRYSNFAQVRLIVLPMEEQRRIANYLDSKCAEIDKVVEQTRATIEEYKKLKQAIITEAVTKGVRGPRPMKPSGVEWIGDIPEEWELQKAKYNINVSHGSDPKSEGDVPVYGSGASSFRTCGEYKEGPTVLIGRKGATLHIPHYITGRYWNVDTAFDVKTDANKFSLRYYYYLATAFDYKYYISQTTLPGMTQSNYLQMKLPVPLIEEQEEIVFYLDTKCAEIDLIIEKKEQLIEELGSYKKSLIYECVTGKREIKMHNYSQIAIH